ncbi:MAG: polysaccharide deacetylase family protein [archaeon]
MGLLTRFYFHGNRNSRKVALTFDDSPSEETLKILKVLKKYNAKATFFVCGKRIKGREKIIKKIISEGHEVGNHTWDHSSLLLKSKKFCIEQISKTDELLKKFGVRSDLFRPPYFRLGLGAFFACRALDKRIVGGDMIPGDWILKKDDLKIIDKILRKARSGSIIILHDYLENIGEHKRISSLTQEVCKGLIKKNFKLVTVSELIRTS